MPTSKLGPPAAVISAGSLKVVPIDPAKLYRVSRHATGEPYFAHWGINRFDAPGALASPPAPEYDCSYFGLTLQVAIAETVLHDLIPVNGAFRLAAASLDAFNVIRFEGTLLKVADLTGPALKALNGNADLAGHDIYDITRQWALAVFRNPALVDGFLYMSRHLNTGKALVLFDRAKPKLRMESATALTKTRGFAAATMAFNIVAT